MSMDYNKTGNIYRPPKGDINNFCAFLLDKIEKIKSLANCEIFILGDFNINYFNKRDPHTRALMWLENVTGFKQLTKDVTRFSANNSCLDLILTDSEHVKNCGTLDVNLSDHEMIFVTRKMDSIIHKKTEFVGRSYRKYDKEKFTQNLQLCNWDNFYSTDNPDYAWELMYDYIKVEIDIMCPQKHFKIKNKKDPWISDELLEQIKDKDNLLKKAKKSNKQEDWDEARRLRNQTKANIRVAKAEFIKSKLEENHKDAKKFWKSLSDLIGNNGKQTNVINLIDQSDNNVEHDKTADFINDFFVSIGPTLARNYNKSWTYQGQIYNCVFPDMLTNEEEVLKLCKEIQETKSSAIDSLSSMILKHALLALIPQLNFLLNLSLKSGKFPQIWKQAVVIPLAKEGDTSNVGNYRPISLLPLPGKILEKIVHDRLMSFLEANNILNKNQGGFRKKLSTTDTIVKFTPEIFSAMNNKETAFVTFIYLFNLL